MAYTELIATIARALVDDPDSVEVEEIQEGNGVTIELRVAKADPWSVMKVSFLLSIALGVCTIVAVAVLWMVMNAMGVFSAIGGTVSWICSGCTDLVSQPVKWPQLLLLVTAGAHPATPHTPR